jgi:hypothetical protein
MHGFVHRVTVKFSIRTNGNALRLLVQVHYLPQHDDGKEGGTEHGGVLGVVVEVPKLQ